MSFETIIKLFGAIAAVISAGKIIYEITAGMKSRLRDEYKFAKEFLADVKNVPDLHPFTLEKGYQAIAGTTTLKTEEVSYILSLKNPVQCLKDYALSKGYLEHLNTTGDLQIAFADKYKSNWSRGWRKTIYVILYFILAFLALFPLVFSSYFHFTPKQGVGLLVFTIPVISPYAWLSLKSSIRIYRGEKLVNNQNKHTRRIILSS